MTKNLTGFRTALRRSRTELEIVSRGRGAFAIQTSPDDLDRIQEGQERDFAMGALDRNSKRLHAVRDALARIDADTFGVCLECEKEIDSRRLAAVPWTALCINCQENADNISGRPWSPTEELLTGASL